MKLFSIIALFSSLIHFGVSQSVYDSALLLRTNQYNTYTRFHESMKERTWINLVNLNEKASRLIETDNLIIEQQLPGLLLKNKTLKDEIEQFKLEAALFKKESELQRIMLDEARHMNKILLIIVGILSVLFLIAMFFFIDRQTRYRANQIELERLWSMKDEKIDSTIAEELQSLKERLKQLSSENTLLNDQLKQVSAEKLDAKKALEKEISSRKEVEKDLRELIEQIRNG